MGTRRGGKRLLLAVLVLGICLVPFVLRQTTGEPGKVEVAASQYPGSVEIGADQYQGRVEVAASQSPSRVVAGVVPHHLLAQDVIQAFFYAVSQRTRPDTVVLLSPDHFHAGAFRGSSFLSVAGSSFLNLPVQNDLIQALCRENPIDLDEAAVGLDHGITNLLPAIREAFPGSRIVPLIVAETTARDALDCLVASLDDLAEPDALVIASVDFSHYLPGAMAAFHDAKSIRVLLNNEQSEFAKIEVDSWQCLYLARQFAQLRGAEQPLIIAHADAGDYSDASGPEGVTSYFSVLFESGAPPLDLPEANIRTVLFVGDIMLDRGVEALIDRNSPNYPFQSVSRALYGVDLVAGNLEVPITAHPVQFPPDLLCFSVSWETASGLSAFNLLSLANNHAFDLGPGGPEETRAILTQQGIATVGDPYSCDPEYAYVKGDLVVLAFNRVGDEAEADLLATIRTIRQAHPSQFLAVFFHWGEEYQGHSSAEQQQLAHQAIDSGADLIVGSHPHVVQEIERYQGQDSGRSGLIVYSLGNFVFDQYFSVETQQGLALGIEHSPGKALIRLFPLTSEISQVRLMDDQESKAFLETLAQASDQTLVDQIRTGRIEISDQGARLRLYPCY